jgi:hypothetical protein
MAKIIGDLNIKNGNLNIGTGTTIDNVLTDILVVDTSGTVKLRDVGTLAEGSSLSASTPYEFTTGTTEGSIQPSYSTSQGISNIGLWTTVAGGSGHTTTKSTKHSFIGGGRKNTLYSNDAVITGGFNHLITGLGSGDFIGAGQGHTITDTYSGNKNNFIGGGSNIVGGYSNSVSFVYGGGILYDTILIGSWASSSIVGGRGNDISYYKFAFIGEGYNNKIGIVNQSPGTVGGGGFIGSGGYNIISGNTALVAPGFYSTNSILNGAQNKIITYSSGAGTNLNATIIGGRQNKIYSGDGTTEPINSARSTNYSFIGNGKTNTINWVTIVTGSSRTATYNFIGNGLSNKVEDSNYGIIGTGFENQITGTSKFSSILNGKSNVLGSGWAYNSILGGYINNIPIGGYSTIVGGYENLLSGAHSVINGGKKNQIIGGYNSYYSSIGGGYGNILQGDYSSIGGGYNNIVDQTTTFNSTNINVGVGSTIETITHNLFDSTIGGDDITVTSGGTTVNLLNISTLYPGITSTTVNIISSDQLSIEFSNTGSSETLTDVVVNLNRTSVPPNSSSIVGGFNNNLKHSKYSTIVGGSGNDIKFSTNSNIGGGYNNRIGGGKNNFIGGGGYAFGTPIGNTIGNSTGSVIVGGGTYFAFNGLDLYSIGTNIIYNTNNSFIGGGISNTISGLTSQTGFQTIVGGRSNKIYGNSTNWGAFIGGGEENVIRRSDNVGILSGWYNKILGSSNSISSNHSSIVGGNGNLINDSRSSTIGGGSGNTIKTNSHYSSILGGDGNTISGLTNTHIIGSNITASTSNTTYVNDLNINDIVTGTTNELVGILSNGTLIKNPILTVADDDSDAALSGVTTGQFYQLSGNGAPPFSGLTGVVMVKQ